MGCDGLTCLVFLLFFPTLLAFCPLSWCVVTTKTAVVEIATNSVRCFIEKSKRDRYVLKCRAKYSEAKIAAAMHKIVKKLNTVTTVEGRVRLAGIQPSTGSKCFFQLFEQPRFTAYSAIKMQPLATALGAHYDTESKFPGMSVQTGSGKTLLYKSGHVHVHVFINRRLYAERGDCAPFD